METARVSYWLKQEQTWQPMIKKALEEYAANDRGTGNLYGNVACMHLCKLKTELWDDLIAWTLTYRVDWLQVIESLKK